MDIRDNLKRCVENISGEKDKDMIIQQPEQSNNMELEIRDCACKDDLMGYASMSVLVCSQRWADMSLVGPGRNAVVDEINVLPKYLGARELDVPAVGRRFQDVVQSAASRRPHKRWATLTIAVFGSAVLGFVTTLTMGAVTTLGGKNGQMGRGAFAVPGSALVDLVGSGTSGAGGFGLVLGLASAAVLGGSSTLPRRRAWRYWSSAGRRHEVPQQILVTNRHSREEPV